MTRTRIVVVPLISALALLATGCGKSKPLTAPEWANGFCTSITTWKDSITSTTSTLKSGNNITKDSVQTAFNEFSSATDTFVKSIKGLGKPSTPAGDQAKKEIDQLATEIEKGSNSIKSDVGKITDVQSALTLVPSVSGTLALMRTAVSTKYHNLQQINAGAELTSAFTNASSCQALTKSARG